MCRVSNTNAFRAPAGGDATAFTRCLLDEPEQVILREGPETIAMIIAEPVRNVGGWPTPPPG